MAKCGFVLLEAVLAIVLMAVGMAVIMQALMQNARLINTFGEYSVASLVIKEKFQEKTVLKPKNTSTQTKPLSGILGKFAVRQEYKMPTTSQWEGFKQVEIQVMWPNPQAKRHIGLMVMVPNET